MESKGSTRSKGKDSTSGEMSATDLSAETMRLLKNKYGQCQDHRDRYCFVLPNGTHHQMTVMELSLWAASIVCCIFAFRVSIAHANSTNNDIHYCQDSA